MVSLPSLTDDGDMVSPGASHLGTRREKERGQGGWTLSISQKMKSSSICSSPGLGSAFYNTMPAAGLAADLAGPGISWPPGLHPLLQIQAGSGQTQAERNAKNQGQVPERRQQEPVSRCGPGVPDGPGHVGERSIGAME